MRALRPITPCLWFDSQAEEAAQLCTGIFPNSKITLVLRYGEAGHDNVNSRRAMEAMLKMKKFDIAALERAYRG